MLKMAEFPKLKTIDTFDFSSSSVDKTLINEILTLRFIDEYKIYSSLVLVVLVKHILQLPLPMPLHNRG
jgi:hypothetical protein